VVVFGAVRPSVAVSATAFGVLAFVAGARTLAGSAAGLRCTPDRLGAMSLRAATVQFGYLVGAAAGGAALAVGGYAAMGWVFGAFLSSAGLLHVPAALRARPAQSAGDRAFVTSTAAMSALPTGR
jgi:DHA1 family inner membrane transport protein